MYAEFLKQAACDIDEAEDGREALAKALTRHPDVIVTETRLAGMSGFDLCRLLRNDPEMHATPIVVVTADAFDSDVRRAEAAGADLVLTKPCLPERLAASLTKVLAACDGRHAETRDPTPAAPEAGHADDRKGRPQAAEARRVLLSRTHVRHDTTEPPIPAPTLVCPSCDQPLKYLRSHVGGVSARHSEQWDYYECGAGCGTFQYRQRTRKLRRVT